MLTIRKASERGATRTSWLDSAHTFSFGGYADPEHMGYRMLRVINDDRVAPEGGFNTHTHREMEIVSYVVEGSLEHKDSLGNGSVIRAGDVQRMTAGTGIAHAEYNPSRTEAVRFLQIWIRPSERGLPPGYEQRRFDPEGRRGGWALLAAPDGRDGALTIHQDVFLWGALLSGGEAVALDLSPGRYGWIQVVRGRARVGGHLLTEGDGVAIEDETRVPVEAMEEVELLAFDLA